MASQDFADKTLLTLDEITRIEATNLSTLEKHHLRLIAYSLASFKAMSTEPLMTIFPDKKTRLDWFNQQVSLDKDPIFIESLLEQLDVAAKYLEKLADQFQILPSEITLDHLIAFSSFQ